MYDVILERCRNQQAIVGNARFTTLAASCDVNSTPRTIWSLWSTMTCTCSYPITNVQAALRTKSSFSLMKKLLQLEDMAKSGRVGGSL